MTCRRIRRPAEGGTEIHRFITNIAPNLVLLSLSEDIPHSIQCDINYIKSTAGIYWSSEGLGVQSLTTTINTTATWRQLQAHSGWQIYHTISRDGEIKANKEASQDIDFSGLQDVSDRPGSVLLSEFSMEINILWSLPYTQFSTHGKFLWWEWGLHVFFIMQFFRNNQLCTVLPTELAISFLSCTAFSCEICADWDCSAGEGVWTGQTERDHQPEPHILLYH